MAFKAIAGFLRKEHATEPVGALVVTPEEGSSFPVDSASGTYAYAAGTSTTTVDVPAGAKLREVSVVAGSAAAATITIGGGATITVPAGGAVTLTKFGATVNLDVVIGGTIQTYYVGWTT